MRSRLRNSIVALFGVTLLSVALASCAGGSSAVPQTAQQIQNVPNSVPNTASQPINASSTLTTIHITNNDRNQVAAHGQIRTHVFPIASSSRTTATVSRVTQSTVHASDMQYFGGALLTNTNVYNAFVDSGPSTFGDVRLFESNLSRSNMVHITDEYVHTTTANRYPWAGDVGVTYPALANLGDNDLLLIIHAVAAGVAGGGLHHLYHIFLPPGLNYCGTGTLLPAGACNASPTSPAPAFCAFHGSVVFNDTGDVIFSVEPYIYTQFCNVDAFAAHPTAPTPNGLQRDSEYSALSHETFESITDPNPGTGWFNPFPFYAAEIGDLCAYIPGPFVNGIAQPQNTILNGKAYRLQFEYSNRQIGCANSPP